MKISQFGSFLSIVSLEMILASTPNLKQRPHGHVPHLHRGSMTSALDVGPQAVVHLLQVRARTVSKLEAHHGHQRQWPLFANFHKLPARCSSLLRALCLPSTVLNAIASLDQLADVVTTVLGAHQVIHFGHESQNSYQMNVIGVGSASGHHGVVTIHQLLASLAHLVQLDFLNENVALRLEGRTTEELLENGEIPFQIGVQTGVHPLVGRLTREGWLEQVENDREEQKNWRNLLGY